VRTSTCLLPLARRADSALFLQSGALWLRAVCWSRVAAADGIEVARWVSQQPSQGLADATPSTLLLMALLARTHVANINTRADCSASSARKGLWSPINSC
jgi:hypothetical protein